MVGTTHHVVQSTKIVKHGAVINHCNIQMLGREPRSSGLLRGEKC